MNTEEAKLIYCHSSTTSFQNQPALTALQLLRQNYKEVEYDRGPMNNGLSMAIMAKEMRDERKRRVTFNNFSGWKHSSAIGDLIARFGFYSTLDIPTACNHLLVLQSPIHSPSLASHKRGRTHISNRGWTNRYAVTHQKTQNLQLYLSSISRPQWGQHSSSEFNNPE